MKSHCLTFLSLALLALIVGCDKPTSGEQAQEGIQTPPGSKVVSFDVPTMECQYCAGDVQKALAGIDGVYSCKTDVETRTVTCTIDPAKFNADLALKKLDETKFPGTLKN